jgi:peptidoglycan/LPS O-acetylase OafA/YrhL
MTFFTLLNAVVARERAGRWSQGRLARWFSVVGVYSYSIYLVHHPVRGVVKYLLESWIAAGDVVTFVAANTVVVLAGYGVGRLFFQLVERRFVTVRAGTGR